MSAKHDLEALRMDFQAERLRLTRATQALADANSVMSKARSELERATESYNTAAGKLACAVADTSLERLYEPVIAGE